MKNYILFFYVTILGGNPILWYSEVINEYQLEPATAQKLELRWVATGSTDTSFNYPFDIMGARIITPAGTSYVDTSIVIYDSSRIMIDSSMLQGEFSLALDSGFIDISHQLDYLVWNPDPTPASGYKIDSCLKTFFHGDYSTTLPPYLNRYKVIYACLGVYPNNYFIDSTSAEAAALREYLENGGTMYLEGGDVWCYDPLYGGFNFAPYFGVVPVSTGYHDMGPISGIAGTFTEGMYFQYSGENFFMDRIAASDSSVEIFRDSDNNYFCGVADNRAVHQTIGTSFELGLVTNGTIPFWSLIMDIQLHFGYSEWTMIPFRDTVFYPNRMPAPPIGSSASAFYLFYYELVVGAYFANQDWYIDPTPTFGSSNDDYPGCAVSGHVYDMGSTPLAGARVIASLLESYYLQVVRKPPFYACCTTYTESDGSYIIDSLLPWRYMIVADMDGYLPDTFSSSYLKNLVPLTSIDFYLSLGITEYDENKGPFFSQMYPNPFTTKFTINMEHEIPYIDIYDITGRLRLRVDNSVLDRMVLIDGSSLPSGIYFIPAGDRNLKIIKY